MEDGNRHRWLHGFLDSCILGLLSSGRDYGRGLSERIAEAGVDEVPGGTLYPALLRLEKQGLVRTDKVLSTSGPPRKYYELTDLGRAMHGDRQVAWRTFRASMDLLIEGTTDPRPTRLPQSKDAR